MVFKNPKEQGTRKTVDLRVGINIPAWLGEDRENDPAAINDARFQRLRNVFLSGTLSERGGQIRSNATPVGNIEHICDTSDIGAAATLTDKAGSTSMLGPGAYFLINAPMGSHGLVRFQWAPPTVNVNLVQPLHTSGNPYYAFNQLLRGSDNNIYAAGARINQSTGIWTPVFCRFNLFDLTVTEVITATAYAVDPSSGLGSMGFLDGPVEDPANPLTFFTALRNLDGFQLGTTFRNGIVDDIPVYTSAGIIDVPGVIAAFNGTFYGFWGGDRGFRDTIRKRIGVNNWTSLVMPGSLPFANAVMYGAFQRTAVAFGKLFFGGGYASSSGSPFKQQHAMFSISTGDVVTKEHVLGTDLVNAWPFDGCVIEVFEFGGNLYYSNFIPPADQITQLGMYDGVTWTDGFWDGKVAGVRFTSGGNDNTPGFFDIGDGSMYCTGTEEGTNQLWILKSAGGDLSTWTKVIRLDDKFVLNGAGGSGWNFFFNRGVAVIT